MRALTVLVTAAGEPGTAPLLRALRANRERQVRVIGTGMSGEAIGRHFCDAFHRVPGGADPRFAAAVLEVCRIERVDAVVPQSPSELLGLAEARGQFDDVAVLVSPPDAVRRAGDNAETSSLLRRIGVHAPEWRRVTGGKALGAAAEELGYPDRAVCFKPASSSGSRGFRVLDPTVDWARQLFEESPHALALKLTEVLQVLPDEGGPELLVMELATGPERSVDGIARHGQILLAHAKTCEGMRGGLATSFQTLRDPALVDVAQRIVEELGIEHFFNLRLVGEHVVGIDPCLSSLVYQDDLNLPYLGVKHALGEISDEQLAELGSRVRTTRRALRYLDQVEWDEP